MPKVFVTSSTIFVVPSPVTEDARLPPARFNVPAFAIPFVPPEIRLFAADVSTPKLVILISLVAVITAGFVVLFKIAATAVPEPFCPTLTVP